MSDLKFILQVGVDILACIVFAVVGLGLVARMAMVIVADLIKTWHKESPWTPKP